MLHPTSLTSIWSPSRWAAWQRGRWISLDSTLVRYLLILAALCMVGCAYLWQASDLSQLHRKIVNLEWQASQLERENVRLAQQSAQWNAPAYIEKRMREEGYVDAQVVIYTRLTSPVVRPASGDPVLQVAQSSGRR